MNYVAVMVFFLNCELDFSSKIKHFFQVHFVRLDLMIFVGEFASGSCLYKS